MIAIGGLDLRLQPPAVVSANLRWFRGMSVADWGYTAAGRRTGEESGALPLGWTCARSHESWRQDGATETELGRGNSEGKVQPEQCVPTSN